MSEKQIPRMMGSLVAHQNLFSALPENLQRWVLQNTEEAIPVMIESIKNWYKEKPVWKEVWKEMTITGKSYGAEKLSKAIRDMGMKVTLEAEKAMQKMAPYNATGKTSFRMAPVSVADLGFKKLVKFEDFLQKALLSGLTFLPQEVGAVLCLQYDNQPSREWLRIITAPFELDEEILGIFCIFNNGRERGLDIYRYQKDKLIDPREAFVFAITD